MKTSGLTNHDHHLPEPRRKTLADLTPEERETVDKLVAAWIERNVEFSEDGTMFRVKQQ